MAHLKTSRDSMLGLKKWWHGLNDVTDVIKLDNSPLSRWDVTKAPLMVPSPQRPGEFIATDYSILTATDDGLPVGGPITETYGVVDNAAFLGLIRDSLAGTGHVIETVGSIKNRSRVFVSVGLREMEKFVAAGREVEGYLNFLNSFDGSTSLIVNAGNHTVVCGNTFRAALRHNGKLVNIRVKHSKNVIMKIENMEEIIGGAVGVQAEFRKAMDDAANAPIAVNDAQALFAGFLSPGEEPSTRSLNTVATLVELFQRGAGNKGENLVDAFNAVTDYYTHSSSGGKNVARQFESSEFGSAAKSKGEFFDIITTPSRVKDTVAMGKIALAFN